mgnify:CR=1 FL=1
MESLNLLGHDTCTACHLRMTATQVVPGYGNLKAKLVFVGEAPGEIEDREGKPFIGPAGQLQRSVLTGMGIDPDRCFFTNVYHCRPPHNDIAQAVGSVCPKIWLPGELSRLNETKVVVALGRTAMKFFRPEMRDWELVRDHALRDTRWPDPETGPLWIVGSYHPSAALKKGVSKGTRAGNVILVSLGASLQRAMYYLRDEESMVASLQRAMYYLRDDEFFTEVSDDGK